MRITHTHALARSRQTGELLLATHEGLFRLSDGGSLRRVGPLVDLMGFAVGPDGTFYASGHPGAGTPLPEPAGLLTSTNEGQTWQVASRGGQSDFHALTAGPTSVVGFDGVLRTTTDRRTWVTRTISSPPRTLTAAPGSGALLATTADGLHASTDDGASWRSLTPPETAVLASWADDDNVVIVTASGRLATSSDRGLTWTLHPRSVGAPEALFAYAAGKGQIEVFVVVGSKILRTTDAGATTTVLTS